MAPDGVRPIVLAVVNERMTALGRCNKARWEAWRREDEARGKAGEVSSPEERARLRAERWDVWGNEARTGFIEECVGLLHPGVVTGTQTAWEHRSVKSAARRRWQAHAYPHPRTMFDTSGDHSSAVSILSLQSSPS